MSDEELGPSTLERTRNDANANGADFEHGELSPSKLKRVVNTSLMILNDDCLLKIFEMLRPIDLGYLLRVNIRLNALAKYYVRLKYGLEERPETARTDFTDDDFERMGYDQAEKYLQIFGHKIRSLNMDCVPNSLTTSDVNRLVKYCRADDVTLINIPIPVYQFRSNHMVNLWFEQLNELRLEHVHSFFNNSDLELLVSKCITLKRLSIVYCNEITTGCFETLATLENLEELEFKMFRATIYVRDCSWNFHRNDHSEDDLRHLLALKKLKILKFGSTRKENRYNVSALLKGFVEKGIAIEHLELSHVRGDDETSDSIARLESIKVLKLNYLTELKKENVVHIVNKLQLLSELHIRMTSSTPCNGLAEMLGSSTRLRLRIDDEATTVGPDQEMLTVFRKQPNVNELELTIYLLQFWMDRKNGRKRIEEEECSPDCPKSSVFHFVGQPAVRSMDDGSKGNSTVLPIREFGIFTNPLDEIDENDENDEYDESEGSYESDESDESDESSEIYGSDGSDVSDESDEFYFSDESDESDESDFY